MVRGIHNKSQFVCFDTKLRDSKITKRFVFQSQMNCATTPCVSAITKRYSHVHSDTICTATIYHKTILPFIRFVQLDNQVEIWTLFSQSIDSSKQMLKEFQALLVWRVCPSNDFVTPFLVIVPFSIQAGNLQRISYPCL